jgi:hypothetical protein
MSSDLVDRRRLAPAFLVGRVPAESRIRRSIVRCWAFALGGWVAALVVGAVARAVSGPCVARSPAGRRS